MKKFDPKAQCEKCGGADIDLTWHDAQPLRTATALEVVAEMITGRFELVVGDTIPAQPECIDCVCGRCGYAWKRKPIKA